MFNLLASLTFIPFCNSRWPRKRESKKISAEWGHTQIEYQNMTFEYEQVTVDECSKKPTIEQHPKQACQENNLMHKLPFGIHPWISMTSTRIFFCSCYKITRQWNPKQITCTLSLCITWFLHQPLINDRMTLEKLYFHCKRDVIVRDAVIHAEVGVSNTFEHLHWSKISTNRTQKGKRRGASYKNYQSKTKGTLLHGNQTFALWHWSLGAMHRKTYRWFFLVFCAFRFICWRIAERPRRRSGHRDWAGCRTSRALGQRL